MGNVTALHGGRSMDAFTPQQLDLVRRTVAADCNDDEFRMFVHASRHLGLDPLRKQIYAFVFNKTKPEKRKMSIIVGIDGARKVAAKSGDYRPDDRPARIEYDDAAKGPNNPLGIVRAEVSVYKMDKNGLWFPIAGEAHWDEFAPLKEQWAEGEDGKRRPTGKVELDQSGNWPRMGRVMIAKCAEMQALRRGWPDDLSNVYEQSEVDRARVIDIDPVEAVSEAQKAQRMSRIGGPGILVAMTAHDPLVAIPAGQLADKAIERINQIEVVAELRWFRDTNREAFRQLWGHDKDAGLSVNKALDERMETLAKGD